jgi:prepilin-type N-terminal cleavage/methylation domain-containing protein
VLPHRRRAGSHDRAARNHAPRGAGSPTRGLTLVELLIVIAVLSIFAGAVLTQFEPTVTDELECAARIVASDLAYARSLAVTNGSSYRLTFDIAANCYVLTHSGANTALNSLPPSPHRLTDDAAHEQTTDLARLPLVHGKVELFAVQTAADPPESVDHLEFGPLGATTRSDESEIWISGGEGDARRYIPVRVEPVTGIAWEGELQAVPPQTAES